MSREPSVFVKTTEEGVQKVRQSKGKYAFLPRDHHHHPHQWCSQDRGGRAEGAPVQGQVRLPARVDNERLLQPEEALQHDERRRQSRLEGLRHRHAHRLRPAVIQLDRFRYCLAVVKVPCGARERRSCTSDYWQTAFLYPRVRKNAHERLCMYDQMTTSVQNN